MSAINSKKRIIHGACSGNAESPEYRSWHSMINRCTNPKVEGWHRYGGRGITVCQRWRESFVAFLEDMGLRPSLNHTIDRIDNDGNYEPDNCRWATKKEQSRNRRNNVFLSHNGKSMTVPDWASAIDMDKRTLVKRLSMGWSVEKTLTTPPRKKSNSRRQHPKG